MKFWPDTKKENILYFINHNFLGNQIEANQKEVEKKIRTIRMKNEEGME